MYLKSNIMHLNKTALAEEISKKVGVSKKEAEEMIDAFVSIITNTLRNGGSVGIAGFGAFSAKTRAGRIGVNPQNPSEKITIPPVTVSKFKAGLALKKALKETDKPKEENTPEIASEPVVETTPDAEQTTPNEPVTTPSEPVMQTPSVPTSDETSGQEDQSQNTSY
jgi:DNA-binding protein HU-beta